MAEDKRIIINAKQRVVIEGYITGLKYDAKKEKLFFNLGHVSNSVKQGGRVFTMYLPSFFYNNAATKLSERTHEGMFVEVEGKLRGEKRVLDIEDLYKRGIKKFSYTDYKLIGTHITGAKQVLAEIPLSEAEEESSND